MEQHSFGYWLRLRRKALDLTREALAERVACSPATIRKLEAEERRPSAQIAERLAEIFAIPPGERAVFVRFARGDPGSAPADAGEDAPWRAARISTRMNLPMPITSLVGRERELVDLHGYLSNPDIRLVTLTGPPGIGKTRLSLAAARAALSIFPGGVHFVALAALDNPSQIIGAIMLAIGYVETKHLSAKEQLVLGIADKRMLIVLDNAEHLIDEVAVLTSDLLTACPSLNILVTSREALKVPGEWLYNVPTLGIPMESGPVGMESIPIYPALSLFAERARAVRSDFDLNPGNIQAVASICRQLDGLPLAIELIAARIRLMSPQALLERMTAPFVLAADGRRAVSARQKTLSSAIRWSYDFLSPEEQKVFACLAVFSGGFTLQAAEAIFSNACQEGSVPDLVAALSDKSLLQRASTGLGETRFSMLVTIQQFALGKLQDTGSEANVRAAHLAYFLAFAEEGDRNFHSPGQLEWVERLEAENDNFHAALEWGLAHQKTASVLRLLRALGWTWEVRGHYGEARGWLEKVRAQPDLCDHQLTYARLLNHIGRHSWTQDNPQEARNLLEEARAIGLNAGTAGELCLAETLNWLGLVALYHDEDPDSTRAMFSEALALNQKWGDQDGVALSAFHLGILESELDHFDAALPLLEGSLAQFQQFGDLFFTARVSLFLGYLFLKQADFVQARFYFEQHLHLDTQLQFWDGIAEGWRDLGYFFRAQGDAEQASQCFEKCKAVCREHGLRKTVP